MYTRCIDSNLESGRYISSSECSSNVVGERDIVYKPEKILALKDIETEERMNMVKAIVNATAANTYRVFSDISFGMCLCLMSLVQQVHNAAVVARSLGCQCDSDTEIP